MIRDEEGDDYVSTNKTVLVIDDQKSFREAVAFEFEMLGFSPIVAENGEDGLEKYKQNKVDIVISDIRMPGWDGRRLLNEIRKISKTSPPFVFMTGFADLKYYEAFHEGADAFLGKPINPDILVKVVETLSAPLGSRWNHKPEEESSGEIDLDVKKSSSVQIGRLGLFVPSSVDEKILDFKIGSLINLQIVCALDDINKISGVGRVLWVRPGDYEGLEPGIGLQFEYLNDECLQQIVSYIEKHDAVETIPKGEKA